MLLLVSSLLLLFEKLDVPLMLVFLLVLFSLLLRWRFALNPRFFLIDAAVLVVVSYFQQDAVLLLGLYIFSFASRMQLVALTPFLAYAQIKLPLPLALFPVLGLLLGLIMALWRKESDTVRQEADELRLKVHRLQEEEHLLLDYQDAQQLSRLEERNHIARILHDSLGHELTAAHLTLKALGSLLQRNEVEKALDSQAKALVRLENSLDQLKLAVRQLQRDDDTANQRFRQLFEQFNYPVDLHQSGDIEVLDPAVQQVLYSAVKEALTNIAKHAKPAMVRAQLAITGTTTRLVLENDGLFDQKNDETGNGLRYMRRRVEALGGSVAIQRDETFRLLITLPSKKEMG
jgi:signal transduction histidine kinase